MFNGLHGAALLPVSALFITGLKNIIRIMLIETEKDIVDAAETCVSDSFAKARLLDIETDEECVSQMGEARVDSGPSHEELPCTCENRNPQESRCHHV
jgi:hypothetical protein